MDDSFLAALFPRRHRILGFRLRPYCFGHLAALIAVGSPLIPEAGPAAWAGAGELIAALRICRRPGFPLVTADDLAPRLRDFFLRWWLERRPARLKRAVDAFVCYRDDHSSFPDFYREEADEEATVPTGRTLTAPALLSRICALISRTSMTWEQAWQMPLALPSWMIGTLDEMEGGHVRFAYEGNEADLPPEEELDEQALYARAVQHLGRAAADKWREARHAAANPGKCQQEEGK